MKRVNCVVGDRVQRTDGPDTGVVMYIPKISANDWLVVSYEGPTRVGDFIEFPGNIRPYCDHLVRFAPPMRQPVFFNASNVIGMNFCPKCGSRLHDDD